MLQSQKIPLTVTRGLAFSTILEYKEGSKRVYTDYTGWEFKAQFRAGKNSDSKLLATSIPVAVGLGQIQLDLTVPQTTLFIDPVAYYDVLAKSPAGVPEKMFEGTVPVVAIVPPNVTLWENVPPVTTASVADDAAILATEAITLTANETAVTYYTTDGTEPTIASTVYAAPFMLAAGTYAIKFFSVDQAGNVETVKTVTNVVVS